MRAFPRTLLAGALTGAGLLLGVEAARPPSLLAQANPAEPSGGQLMDVYKDGTAAFSAGDYRKAADSMKAVLAKASEGAALESVYYTLGAALYNLPDYPGAIDALTKFRTKYPKGARFTDATYALAQAQLATKNYGEAIKLLATLESVPALRERALLLQAEALKADQKVDDAIVILKRLVGADPKSPLAVQGALLLVSYLAEKGDAAAAATMLTQLASRPALVNNAVQLNSVAIELGDRLAKEGKFPPALSAYRLARTREAVVDNQKRRVAVALRAAQANLEAIRANPAQVAELAAQGADLRTDVEAARGQLEEAEKLPARYDSALLLRMARCFGEMSRPWESIVIYRQIVDRAKPEGGDAPEREPAFYGLIVSLADVAPAEEIRAACNDYLKDYPEGPNSNAVAYLSGASALQSQDLETAATVFGRMLDDKNQQSSPFREQMLYGLGNAQFLQGKYDEALSSYARYRQTYPRGSFSEEISYRTALAQFFLNKTDDARKGFAEYVSQYPGGVYLSDAKYRQGMLRFASEEYPETIKACEDWETQFGADNPQLGEVLSLKGDALASLDRNDEAITAYERGAKVSTTDEVANYTLTEAGKLLQKTARWDDIAAFGQEFVQLKPESPVVLPALGMIAKAKSRSGKVEEARAFLAETVRKYLADPKRDAVEPMLSQLVGLCLKRPAGSTLVGAPTPPPAAAGAETPAAPAAGPVYDPEAELNRLLLGDLPDEKTLPPAAQARVLFARSELAKLRKKPAEADAAFQTIADRIPPDDLSQALLAQVGDFVLSKGQNDRATAIFNHLMDEHPKGDYVDFAYNGLGEIAYQKKDYNRALKYFVDAVEKGAAASKLKDVTLGKAKTQLALGKFDEAKKGFQQVASVREWRGEATAYATYSLGETEKQQGHLAEAHAHFQRVYVVYGKYLPWVAKAYLEAADCLDKLDKKTDAANTLREMLRNTRLAEFKEAQEARDRLQKMGAS